MSLFDRSPQGNIQSPTTAPTLGSLFYSNARLPIAFNGNAESAINYIFATLYPNYISTVANVAALPLTANPNDYYIVSNDGDGKSAGYVWVVRDNAGGWEKKYDVDWSYEGIYSETLNRTQYVYVSKNGYSQRNALGVVVTGLYAGQTIYGGDATLQNLTFNANSFDGTGYVQTDNSFRPTADNSIDLGTAPLRFGAGYFGSSIVVGTLTLSGASIVDSTGTIGFDNENLTTTGNVTAASFFATTQIQIGLPAGRLILAPGSITDESGLIAFGNENLTTTGIISAGSFVATSSGTFGDITISTGSIIATGGVISFGNEDLSTTGTFSAGDATVTRLTSDNIRLDGNTISIIGVNGNLILSANGTGIIDLQSAATTLGVTATGVVTVTGQVNADNLRFDGNIISSTDLNGAIRLQPNGTGDIVVTARTSPNANNTLDLGGSALRFKDLYLGGNISDGTTSISQPTLQSLRDINVGVVVGMALFYDGTKWVASAPDTEITHGTLSGLTTGDAGHTQFVMLAGRSGGQTVQGGTAASNLLILESTSSVTKGTVQTKDNFVPFTNASFSGTWSGTDLGSGTNFFRDVNTKGEFFGLRLQNVAANPASSAQNIGRLVWNTVDKTVYLDTGVSYIAVGDSEKFTQDTVWDGILTTQDFNVSSEITDARTSLWQLCDNANDFERIYTVIKAISATTVRVVVSPALPAGSYRLIGIN